MMLLHWPSLCTEMKAGGRGEGEGGGGDGGGGGGGGCFPTKA